MQYHHLRSQTSTHFWGIHIYISIYKYIHIPVYINTCPQKHLIRRFWNTYMYIYIYIYTHVHTTTCARQHPIPTGFGDEHLFPQTFGLLEL